MKFKQNYVTKFIFLSLFFIVLSCSSDSLYESTNNEPLALGELKSLVIRPGLNKVSVEGVINDQNVSEVKIYWKNKTKSITVPVTNNGTENTFATEIDNLKEGFYIFENELPRGRASRYQ
jgi:archaellum component FlaF (FlaF/FlaG flagellin family)